MNHKVDILVEVEKNSLFGRKKTVLEPRTKWVDDKTYSLLKKSKTFHAEEESLFDEIFGS